MSEPTVKLIDLSILNISGNKIISKISQNNRVSLKVVEGGKKLAIIHENSSKIDPFRISACNFEVNPSNLREYRLHADGMTMSFAKETNTEGIQFLAKILPPNRIKIPELIVANPSSGQNYSKPSVANMRRPSDSLSQLLAPTSTIIHPHKVIVDSSRPTKQSSPRFEQYNSLLSLPKPSSKVVTKAIHEDKITSSSNRRQMFLDDEDDGELIPLEGKASAPSPHPALNERPAPVRDSPMYPEPVDRNLKSYFSKSVPIMKKPLDFQTKKVDDDDDFFIVRERKFTTPWIGSKKLPVNTLKHYFGSSASSPVQVDLTRQPRNFEGMVNMGNTCYMAAVMQAVFGLKDFVDDLMSPFWTDVYEKAKGHSSLSQDDKENLKVSCLNQVLTVAR